MAKIYQDNRLERDPEFHLERGKDGLWSGTQPYHCRRDDLAEVAPRPREAHPLFGWVHVDSMSVTGLEDDDQCRLDVRYAGAFGLDHEEPEVENPPVYALEISVSEEPLETHPRYTASVSAADIREVVEMAKNPPREDDGTMSTVDQTGWAALKSELYGALLGGVESYRDPKATWTKRWVSDARPSDLNEVGKIQTPEGSPPAVATGRNWINAGLRSTERGIVYENEKTWELSGRGGWNTNWYV